MRHAGNATQDDYARSRLRPSIDFRRSQHRRARGNNSRPYHADGYVRCATILIGPNGSGKTTLLRAAMGLTPLSNGRITWGDRNKRRRRKAQSCFSVRRCCGVRPRQMCATRLPPPMSPARNARNKPPSFLHWSGLANSAAARPGVFRVASTRLALARALARDPAVLFLDEPTASLDPYSTKAIEDIVRAVSARGVKVVMSTHDIGQAKRLAGDVVLLHRGRLIESTRAPEFFVTPHTEEARKFIAGELLV